MFNSTSLSCVLVIDIALVLIFFLITLLNVSLPDNTNKLSHNLGLIVFILRLTTHLLPLTK